MHCPSNCLSLLLTNGQISAETQSVLDRVQSSPTDYHLDISVLDDLDLFPTWLSVPRITNVSLLFSSMSVFSATSSPGRPLSGTPGMGAVSGCTGAFTLCSRALRV
ncbi:hypothetical protein MPDQ_000595 [Monascus purpureus]|uniref:Uncharacterized protein n=1 Tax=Monascus purpureus TaxID=5098 RepID=A0A507QRS8_MONPU|nr:hypothetical protein MPDQ_000595 [Monascus purpureus]